MASGGYRFQHFCLDPAERRLWRDGTPVELNTRYLDALLLLLREQGRLVSKARFMDEVWRGVPVTDEALTQCIRMLRRQLGDSATSPRFIETVPKHGYRFIAPVERVGSDPEADRTAEPPSAGTSAAHPWRQFLVLGAAGTLGGGVAGVIGGLFFGFAAAAQPVQGGTGAISAILVLITVTILVASVGAAGVAFGIAAAGQLPQRRWPWSILGGAAGGLIVGAVVKLLGVDAFHLLFGRSPGDITGAFEGLVLGAAVGIGAWLAGRRAAAVTPARALAGAALAGGAAGIVIPLLGGRLMSGSLDLLARSFPDSRLRLDQIGAVFGENGFGPVAQIVVGGFEGALFAVCIVGAMMAAHSRYDAVMKATHRG